MVKKTFLYLSSPNRLASVALLFSVGPSEQLQQMGSDSSEGFSDASRLGCVFLLSWAFGMRLGRRNGPQIRVPMLAIQQACH